jgi:hypothetical protein
VTDSGRADPTPNQGEIDAQPVDTGEPRGFDKAAPEIARTETQSAPTSAEPQHDPIAVGSRFSNRTLVGTLGNGQDALIPAISQLTPRTAGVRPESRHLGNGTAR